MSTDWARLEHAYGSAADVPELFEQVGDADLADDAWSELWESLCHQGTWTPPASRRCRSLPTSRPAANRAIARGLWRWPAASSWMRLRDDTLHRLNLKGRPLTGVRPAASGELGPLASRLHRLASAAGQPAAAQHVALLFGTTTCPDCGADFSLPEQIEAILS